MLAVLLCGISVYFWVHNPHFNKLACYFWFMKLIALSVQSFNAHFLGGRGIQDFELIEHVVLVIEQIKMQE